MKRTGSKVIAMVLLALLVASVVSPASASANTLWGRKKHAATYFSK